MSNPDIRARIVRVARIGLAWIALTNYWVLVRICPRIVLGAARQGACQPRSSASQLAAMRDVVSAVDRAASLHPLRPFCLERALTCRWLLALHGHDARVAIGVTKRRTMVEAHAWVEIGSFSNDAARAEFTTLTHLS